MGLTPPVIILGKDCNGCSRCIVNGLKFGIDSAGCEAVYFLVVVYCCTPHILISVTVTL